jgi:four helix bundle protein
MGLGLKLDAIRAKVLADGRLMNAGEGHSRFGRFLKRARKWIRVGGEDPMYECFTDRARKVMALANQEAQRFNHEYIGTEHLLLGLALEGSGVGATALRNLGVDLAAPRTEVEKLIKSGPDVVTIGKRPQTPRAKVALECAIGEARALNHNYVGTEHLLLGLLRESEGIAAQVLMNLGLQLGQVRNEVLRLLGVAEGPVPVGAGEGKPGVANYRDLPVWQKADELAQQVYAVTGTFPPEPIPGVAARLREMALALPPHIAEAHSRPIPVEAKWFLNAAFGSLRELRYLLDFAKRLEFLKPEDHQRLAGLAEEVDQLLRRFYAAPGP